MDDHNNINPNQSGLLNFKCSCGCKYIHIPPPKITKIYDSKTKTIVENTNER